MSWGAFRHVAARVALDLALIAGGTGALVAAYGIVSSDWGLAYDTHAYWLAGRHILDGSVLYAPASPSDLGAFKYPPLFAQMAIPLALLPEIVADWVWRVTTVLCLRYVAGSWRAALVACAFLPVLSEVSLGNVTLQIAALLVFCLRDRRGAYLLPWAAALKFGPALIVPYLWFRMPESRRPLLVGAAVFAAACVASFALAPDLWGGYIATFGWEGGSTLTGGKVMALIPSSGMADFVLRLVIAAVLALAAVPARKAWLAYAAAAITCPIFALSRLAPLVGLWRFRPGAGTADAGTEALR
jgi:hypothetical protein